MASAMEGKRVYSVSVPVSEKIRFALMIPPFELKTEKARAALPKEYSREDAVYNLSRSGLMTASLFSGEAAEPAGGGAGPHPPALPAGLIDHYDDVFRMSYELGSLGTYVSGAGPTIIAMIDAENADAFGRSCVSHLEDKGITGWRVEILSADP